MNYFLIILLIHFIPVHIVLLPCACGGDGVRALVVCACGGWWCVCMPCVWWWCVWCVHVYRVCACVCCGVPCTARSHLLSIYSIAYKCMPCQQNYSIDIFQNSEVYVCASALATVCAFPLLVTVASFTFSPSLALILALYLINSTMILKLVFIPNVLLLKF